MCRTEPSPAWVGASTARHVPPPAQVTIDLMWVMPWACADTAVATAPASATAAAPQAGVVFVIFFMVFAFEGRAAGQGCTGH